MRAIVQEKYGDIDTLILKNVEMPVINNKQMLIKIHATNIASGDMRINKFEMPYALKPLARLLFGFNGPRNKIRGISASGEIVQVGSEVKNFKIGDKVNFINSMKAGCLAEYIALSEKSMVSVFDDSIKYEEAAPIAFGAMAAYHFINEDTIKPGMDVLIYGASGSVGTYAISLAKYFGANVTAVCKSKNSEVVKNIGADKVIDYTEENVLNLGKKYDLIFDSVMKFPKKEAIKILKENGKYMSTRSLTTEKKEKIEYLNKLLKEKKITTVIDKVFDFEDYKEAHKLVYSKHKVGNVVIKIND